MLVPILVSLLFSYSLCKEFQINAPGESIKGFWPGDQQINPGERCAIATTNTKVFRIVGGRASGQTIHGMVAAAGIYNQATTAMWYDSELVCYIYILIVCLFLFFPLKNI
jgi:hypothetical protein